MLSSFVKTTTRKMFCHPPCAWHLLNASKNQSVLQTLKRGMICLPRAASLQTEKSIQRHSKHPKRAVNAFLTLRLIEMGQGAGSNMPFYGLSSKNISLLPMNHFHPNTLIIKKKKKRTAAHPHSTQLPSGHTKLKNKE